MKNGEWQIIDNRTIDGEIEMPFFWTQDVGDMKYYIRKVLRIPIELLENVLRYLKMILVNMIRMESGMKFQREKDT